MICFFIILLSIIALWICSIWIKFVFILLKTVITFFYYFLFASDQKLDDKYFEVIQKGKEYESFKKELKSMLDE